MLNIYGNRSIIPNNYYFSFDKIYASESDLQNSGGSDAVLIGRMALAKAESTVWLKTVGGYQKVAKLDNEGRFLYLEGYDLETYEDIDDLRSQGNTLNGDGCYLVQNTWGTYPYPTNKQNQPYYPKIYTNLSDYITYVETDIATEFELDDDGKFAITGRTYYTDNAGTSTTDTYTEDTAYYKTINPYAADSIFVLYQYSEKADNLKTEETVNGFYSDYSTLSDAIVGNLTVWQGGEIVAAGSSAIRASTSSYNLLNSATVNVYQIIIDITNKDKKDNDTDRASLNHYDKSFIRKGVMTYELNDDDTRKATTTYYIFDSDNYKFQQDTTTSIPQTVGHLYTRTVEWEDWQDVSEQYTGYIGDLNPDYDYVLEDGINRSDSRNIADASDKSQNNLAKSSDLVDAINTLDFLIGGREKLENNRKTVNDNAVDGGYDSVLEDDNRPYNIPEDNIMDAIIHHDADIGPIEEQTALNNVVFSKASNADASDTALEDTSAALGTYSLTNMIKVLDRIIGAYYMVATAYTDARPNHLSKDQDITTNLQHLAADIGAIEEFKDGLNNITFSTTADDSSTTLANFNDSKDDNDKLITTFNVQSIANIIKVLDKIIGQYQDINTAYQEVSTTRTNHLNGNDDLVTSLKHLAADLGKIEDFDYVTTIIENGENVTTTTTPTLNNMVFVNDQETDTSDLSLSDNIDEDYKDEGLLIYRAESLANMVRILDTIIGVYREVDKSYDSRANDVLSDTESITENLRHLAVNTGAIESIGRRNNITDNSGYVENCDQSVAQTLTALNEHKYLVNSLTEAIVALDTIIGGQQTVENNYGHDDSDDRKTNFLSDDEDVVTNIAHIATDLGEIEDLSSNNLVFSGTESTTDATSGQAKVQSVVQALNVLDTVLGALVKLSDINDLNTSGSIVTAINYINDQLIDNLSTISTTNSLKTSGSSIVNYLNYIDEKIIGNLSNISQSLNLLNDKTVAESLKTLDSVLGDKDSFTGRNNSSLDDATVYSALEILDLLLGNISNLKDILNEKYEDDLNLVNIILSLDETKMDVQTFEELVELVNNLGENMDILDVTLKSLLDNQGTSSSVALEWGTF